MAARKPKAAVEGDAGLPIDVMMAQDAAAATYSLIKSLTAVPPTDVLRWDRNIFASFTQSIGIGGIAHPPVTNAVPKWGITVQQIGTSPRAARESDIWYPFGAIGKPSKRGTFALRPAVSSMDIDNPTGGNRYDHTTFAVPVLGGIYGEAVVTGMTYEYMRIRQLALGIAGNEHDAIPIVSAHGFGGQRREALLSDATMPRTDFSARLRMESYLSQLYDLSAPTKTVGISVVYDDQGTANARSEEPGDFGKLLRDTRAMINQQAASLNDDGFEPLHLIAQVAGSSVNNGALGNSVVPQAIHEYCLEEPNAALVAVHYGVPSKMKIPVSVDVVASANTVLWGEQIIDGVQTSNSAIAVIGNDDSIENGLWVSASGPWSRWAKHDLGDELLGLKFHVNYGEVHAGHVFAVTNNVTPEVGAEPIDIVDQGPGSLLPSTADVHMAGNSIRWLGAYAAKYLALRREGKDRPHVHVIEARAHGRQCLVSWHLPVGRLRILHAFDGYRPVIDGDFGYSFSDGVALAVTDAKPWGSHSVLYTFDREIDGTSVTGTAGRNGHTNISDSDLSVSCWSWEHSPQEFSAEDPDLANMTPHEAAIEADVIANLGPPGADILGKPYPLPNRACLQTFPIQVI